MNPEPTSDAARRAARRAAVRAHHPDVGGDPDDLQRALEAIDGPLAGELEPLYDVRPTSRLRLIRRKARKRVRNLRTHLPRAVPGSTRYHRL